MGTCIFRDGTVVSDYGRPYIIAEVNSSHNGDIEIAKRMIDAAKRAGCDCVKFQSWSAETLYSKTYYKANPIAKRFVDKFSLSEESLKKLAEYCNLSGIGFSSTPYSEREVDFLVEINAPFIKIASMELNNPKFLKYIAKKNIPLILSTGMGETAEIMKAVDTIFETGNSQLVLLHCVSVYPAEESTINLNNIVGLREYFPKCPIGFSDHTLGDTVGIAATALGAAVLEKHLTLDKKKIGMDNQMAMEPDELAEFVRKCRLINIALGRKDRVVFEEELKQRGNMRRSIVAACDIVAGQKITEHDLCAKRPGTGIPPCEMDILVGKVAVRNIEADTVINIEDVK